ncbi:MAG: thioredoxin family protein [Bacillota bacterium]
MKKFINFLNSCIMGCRKAAHSLYAGEVVVLFFRDSSKTPKSTLVSVGGAKVGIVGLEDAFQKVDGKVFPNDDALGEAIIDLIKDDNYIPASARDKYREGLVRAYKAARGIPVEPARMREDVLEIKVVGPGCPQCRKLYKEILAVLQEMNVGADVEKVEDVNAIADVGVILTPALIINGQTKVAGRVPSRNDLKKWIEEAGR